jgi:hypothetical protein
LLLHRQKSEFWQSFDILVLSIYPGKHTPASLQWIIDSCSFEGVELVVKDETRNPNFKTLLEKVPTNPAQTRAKFQGCFFRGFSRVANYGFFFTCCCAPHMPLLMRNEPYGTDGVAIEGLTETGLNAYLNRSEPLVSCTTCAGRDTAVNLPWAEERDPQKWLRASAGANQ